jgi:DNA-binding response OmpR family regulator
VSPTPAGVDRAQPVEFRTPRIMLVEDDAAQRDGLVAALALEGYQVAALADGRDLADELARFQPDLVLLDVYFDVGPDGFELASVVRTSVGVPILFVTAADGLDERLRGFELGADDYVVKPFAVAEVVARVRAVLRRAGRTVSATLEVRDITIDEECRTVRRGSDEIELSTSEFDLLCTLARHPGVIHSKTQLLLQVWGFAGYSANLVEVCMSSLRRKLEAHGPRIIFTVHSQGYVLRARGGTPARRG